MSSRKTDGEDKDFTMEMFSKEGSRKVFRKVGEHISGQVVQNTKDNLIVDCVQVKEFFQLSMDLNTADNLEMKNLKDYVNYQCQMEMSMRVTFAKVKRTVKEY